MSLTPEEVRAMDVKIDVSAEEVAEIRSRLDALPPERVAEIEAWANGILADRAARRSAIDTVIDGVKLLLELGVI